jgi:hypothetical protein
LQKKVPIKPSLFGDYVVTYVHYPGEQYGYIFTSLP